MRTRSSWIWCWIIGAVLASGAGAQQYTTIIDNLPTCTGNRNGRIIAVSDATSDSDCTTGGATGEDRFVHPCICDTLNALGPYWKAVGGGAGVTGLTSCADGTALADNALMRADGTTKCQGSTVTVADSTGNLQWEGTTADAFEGNFTFADPTADWTLAFSATGAAKFPDGLSSAPSITLSNTAVGFYKDADIGANFIGFSASTPSFRFGQATIEFVGNGYIAWGNQTNTFSGSGVDTIIQRGAAGIVRIQDALRLTPVASPPAACAAGTEGAIYSDDSHALCWCDASAWQKLSGAGTCA